VSGSAWRRRRSGCGRWRRIGGHRKIVDRQTVVRTAVIRIRPAKQYFLAVSQRQACNREADSNPIRRRIAIERAGSRAIDWTGKISWGTAVPKVLKSARVLPRPVPIRYENAIVCAAAPLLLHCSPT
jgi:hypothetical protein